MLHKPRQSIPVVPVRLTVSREASFGDLDPFIELLIRIGLRAVQASTPVSNTAPGPAATAPEPDQVQLFQPSPTGKPSRKPRKPRAPAQSQSTKPSPKKRRKKT